jgi:hypothetical protein
MKRKLSNFDSSLLQAAGNSNLKATNASIQVLKGFLKSLADFSELLDAHFNRQKKCQV